MSSGHELDPEHAAALARSRERALRREIADELRATVRREVEDDVRRESRAAVLREIAARAPTADERRRAVVLIEEIELDALAQAAIASSEADEAEHALDRNRRVRAPFS